MEPDAFLSTRRSLITRLKNWDDREGWQDFFRTYWKLIYSVAIKSGLSDSESEDAVQETVVTVAKTMSGYRYEPDKCRFKTWLMRITRMRVVDQFRKRGRGLKAWVADPTADTELNGPEHIEDPATPFLETLWDEEWRKNLIDVAMDRVKRRVNPVHYQIFYLSVVKELGATQVARTLGVSAAQVYLARHRVAGKVKKEIKELERSMNPT